MIRVRSSLLAGSLALLAMACNSSLPTASDLEGRGRRNNGRNNFNSFIGFGNAAGQFGPIFNPNIQALPAVVNGGFVLRVSADSTNVAICPSTPSVCAQQFNTFGPVQQSNLGGGFIESDFFLGQFGAQAEVTVFEAARNEILYNAFTLQAANNQMTVTQAPDADPTGTVVGQTLGSAPVAVNNGNAQVATGGSQPATGGAQAANVGAVSYARDIVPILNSGGCLTCHNKGETAPDLSTYDGAKAAAGSSSADIQSGKMPLNGTPLDPTSKAKFAAWVQQGEPQ